MSDNDHLERDLQSLFRNDSQQMMRLMAEATRSPEGRNLQGLSAEEQRVLEAYDDTEALWENAPTARPGHRRPLRRWGILAAAGLAAAAAAVVMLQPTTTLSPSLAPALNPKGAPSFRLHVAVQRQGRISRMEAGEYVTSGDRLGFFYSVAQPGHLRIQYVQSDRVVKTVFPAPGSTDRIDPAHEGGLPVGLALDEGSGCEWVIAIYSDSSVEEIRSRALVDQMVRGGSACHMGQAPPQGQDNLTVTVFPIRWRP